MNIYAIEKKVNGKWVLFATPPSTEANNEDAMLAGVSTRGGKMAQTIC